MAQLCPICNPKSGSRANPLPKHLQLTYFLLRVQETIYSKNIHRHSRDLYQHAIKVCLGIKVNFALLISSKFPSIWRQMAHYQHGHWPVRWDSNDPKFLWYANLIFSHVSVSKIYFNLSNSDRKRRKPLECRPKYDHGRTKQEQTGRRRNRDCPPPLKPANVLHRGSIGYNHVLKFCHVKLDRVASESKWQELNYRSDVRFL